ncbi:hypothetical protein GJ496_001202 [Pomphorhynchus laevis]|nr:hypothetical protein GJ496_001202 [Pomphorhynchus laevis]
MAERIALDEISFNATVTSNMNFSKRAEKREGSGNTDNYFVEHRGVLTCLISSYIIIEMIAKAVKPFTKAASIVCPKKKILFCSISLSDNTVAERISNISSNIFDQLSEKLKCFSVYSVALDETTDITYTSQLAIYVRGVDEKFHVIEELLTVNPLHGRTTAQEIFHLMCDALENVGLSWKRGNAVRIWDVIYFTKVRCLSIGNVLKRFFRFRVKVKALVEKDGDDLPMLGDHTWIMDLLF